MSEQIVKSSMATITASSEFSLIRIVETINPEEIIAPMMRRYMGEIGFQESFPNFKTVRIGTVHPFAILLFAGVMGTQSDLSVFPSITIADSNDSEHAVALARDYDEVLLTMADMAVLESFVDSKRILLSATNLQRIKDRITATGKPVLGRKVRYSAYHNIDVNIWADNKAIVSIIYDMVKHFFVDNTVALHEEGLDLVGSVGGRRTGDINVEFGSLLYGANVTVQCAVETGSMTVNLPVSEIENIVVHDTEINFHGGE